MVTMYTTTWCAYCRRLKRGMTEAGIDFTEVDIEQDPDAAELVMSVNGGNMTVPTVLFADGTALTNPSLPDVQSQLAQVGESAGRQAR
jgi:mycoredoxin